MFCTQCNKSYDKKTVFCPIHGRKLINDPKEAVLGQIIDNKYLIETEVGEGGTGTVYQARHVKLDMTCAIKILHNKFTDDPVAIERFRREAYASMQIRHPNAIAVMDFGTTPNNLVYVVMEYLVGITLRDRLEQKPIFTIQEANALMQPICEAVNVAHKVGIVHRDLKPENIFLDHSKGNEEVVKVLDFGIARMTSVTEDQQKRAMRLTQEGILIGTPHYMSPEQCYGRDVDARSDVYALGIMLYEMLTGQLPFDDRSLSIVAVKQAREKARPTYEINPNVPHIVNAVVMKAMEKKAENRPPSVMAFAQELQSVVKMVSEKEFQSVFLNASDEDLEAALLLTNLTSGNSRFDQIDPRDKSKERFLEKSFAPERRRNTKPLVANPENNLTEQTTNQTTYFNQNRTVNTYLSLTSNELTVVKNIRNSDDEFTEENPTFNAIRIEDPAVIEGLYEQLLHLIKETPILMQIIASDLETKKPIDMVFLTELKYAVDNIRNIIFRLEKTASKF
ncbi:MAG: serine/threonine protein kinase [Acidobacteria bacterium]|nr:serine/threonine protein kinase [Acidobacteriota bacterium]